MNGRSLLGKAIYPMSSGEKQKIAVASVNAVNPGIYVFDEPSANLDMFSVEALRQLMKELKAEGHTVLVAEHRLYYLADLGARFFYMQNGRIQEESLPAQGLSFSYGSRPVFENISFKLHAGDTAAVIGRNGIGKTTLSNVLCGIQKERSGKLLFDEKALPPKKRKHAAYFVMQNTDLQLFGDSVAGELRLNRKHADDQQLEELLALYDLSRQKDCHPTALSGGQKQRLTLAISDWINTPILILDEPASGLNFQNMQRISRHLKALSQKGKTVLIITHDFEFAAITCNRAIHFIDESHMEKFPLKGNLSRLYDALMCP